MACWGFDEAGQATPPAGEFHSVSASDSYSCGLKTEGSVVCWGEDDIIAGAPYTPVPEDRFLSISAHSGRACGVSEEGAIVCWGHWPYLMPGS